VTAGSTRAILIERHGPPEALVEREVPLRDPGSQEVHVRVRAVGLNFADLLMRAGLYDTVPPRPYSPGFEIAGEIARVGAGVTDWREGERVVALIRYGGYAHDVIVPADQVFHYPDSLTFAEAAAVPVAFLTAWVCLFETGHVRAGEIALVLGAGGGVGTALVQFCVRHGLRVIGTAGDERKRAFVTGELGAEACFDSRGDWEADVRRLVGPRGVSIAFDAVGARATAACRRLLAPLGRLVFYGLSDVIRGGRRNWPRAAWTLLRTPLVHPLSLIQPNIGVFGVHLLHLGEREGLLRPALGEIYRDIGAGALRPVVDRVFSLTRAGAVDAHRYVHERRNLGKVILADESGAPA
jgi:NADPH:quinone reductase-like Zn-dependent oxidoreductase